MTQRYDSETSLVFMRIQMSLTRIQGRLLNQNLDDNERKELKKLAVDLRSESKKIKTNYQTTKTSVVKSYGETILKEAKSYTASEERIRTIIN